MFRYGHGEISHFAKTAQRWTLVGAVMTLILAVGLPFADSAQAVSTTTSKFHAKKGIDAWTFAGTTTALARSGASWYLNWSSSPDGIVAPKGVHFVPMIWGSSYVTSAALSQAERYGPDLLTFNEPDSSSQANMTVAQALSLWPQLEATGLQLGSPAVSSGASTPGGWLDQFMQGAAALNYRVNFIALHWYGPNFGTTEAVSRLRAYLVSVHDVYPTLSIWLTEYAITDYSGSVPQYPSEAQQAAFVSASIKMLDSLPWLVRFAWYALPTTGGTETGLFNPGATPTPAGQAFSKAP
jgi:hypothetical protein